MEIWDVYNRDRIPTGEKTERGSELKENQFHLVVHICIFNNKNELLIQQRHSLKTGWPGRWDFSAAGSALSGENSSVAAERELLEEIGFQRDFSSDRPFFTINFPEGFDDFYLIEEDLDISALKLQKEEVQDIRWASKDEILKMLRDEEFVPYYESLIHMVFDMKKQRGALRYE